MTRFKTIAAFAVLSLAATALPAGAQYTTKNIGPAPTPGFPGPGGCVAVTLAGSTYVRICNGGYTAQLGGTYCNGSAWQRGFGNAPYTLNAGGCNNGQQFLGGTLQCNGTYCNWTPSAAGFAAGFRAETVYAQYQ